MPTPKPIKRKDLQDWFPGLSAHYAGYIRQEVFRVTIISVLQLARKSATLGDVENMTNPMFLLGSAVRDNNVQTNNNNQYWRDFRRGLKSAIDCTIWYKWNSEKYYESLLTQAIPYLKQPVVDLAVRKVAGKATAGMGNKISKSIKAGNHKVLRGMVASKSVTKQGARKLESVFFGVDSKIKPKGWNNAILDWNVADIIADTATSTVTDPIADKFQRTGIEVGFDNELTRGWTKRGLQAIGVSDKWASKISSATMGGVDFATDLMPIVGYVAKPLASALVNWAIGGTYLKAAWDTKKNYDENEKMWKNMNEEIKEWIKQDISGLNNGDLLSLLEYLKIK